MTLSKMLALFCAALLVGAWRGFKPQYLEWKARRAALPEHIRNAGFITDARLLWGERVVVWSWWAFVAAIVGFTLLLVSSLLIDRYCDDCISRYINDHHWFSH